MWIIFGWQKIETPLGEVGATRCFDCQRDSQWLVWNVSEWVTFSALKVFRFIHKHELQCSGCSTTLALHSREFKQIDRHMRSGRRGRSGCDPPCRDHRCGQRAGEPH